MTNSINIAGILIDTTLTYTQKPTKDRYIAYHLNLDVQSSQQIYIEPKLRLIPDQFNSFNVPSIVTVAQVMGISTSLIAAGGIAALSLFDIPILRAPPASRSLPSVRWLSSRGSHVFPIAAYICCGSFGCLAYVARSSPLARGYIAAAVLTFSIAPFTMLAMIPTTNFRLIELNEKLGGARSQKAADEGVSEKSAEESVSGKVQAHQFTDLSDPQEKAPKEGHEDEVKMLLSKFGRLNLIRALLMGTGGIIGLATVL